MRRRGVAAAYARRVVAHPALLVESRVIRDVHGRRIEATESAYTADRYALEVQFEVEGRDVGHSRTDA